MSRFPSAAPAHAAPDLSGDVRRAAPMILIMDHHAAIAIAMITAWSTRPKKKMWHAIWLTRESACSKFSFRTILTDRERDGIDRKRERERWAY